MIHYETKLTIGQIYILPSHNELKCENIVKYGSELLYILRDLNNNDRAECLGSLIWSLRLKIKNGNV